MSTKPTPIDPIIDSVCTAIRAGHQTLLVSWRLIEKCTDGRRTINVTVDKAKEGDVKFYLDSDGYHDGACSEALDALQNRLEAKGVRFTLDTRRRKDGRPAFDGRRIP